MNTPCKLLAMAWMALRPFCTNVHADTINWEKVSHFFNFETSAEEPQRTNLATNIQVLVEEQLKLPSGQNLWKAFLFWENQHPELGFQFEFSLIEDQNAHIGLKKYEDATQIFTFEIVCNPYFANKIFKSEELININMLYRPCLIKLIDPDDPENWSYHLREQELPFFITLAHEFLHALNQLERIDLCWFSSCHYFENSNVTILDNLNAIMPMENFLAEKLGIQDDDVIFNQACKKLWGSDHFLDEMTVILSSERKIGESEFVFIGETTFLREYYKDNTIISWSHASV